MEIVVSSRNLATIGLHEKLRIDKIWKLIQEQEYLAFFFLGFWNLLARVFIRYRGFRGLAPCPKDCAKIDPAARQKRTCGGRERERRWEQAEHTLSTVNGWCRRLRSTVSLLRTCEFLVPIKTCRSWQKHLDYPENARDVGFDQAGNEFKGKKEDKWVSGVWKFKRIKIMYVIHFGKMKRTRGI